LFMGGELMMRSFSESSSVDRILNVSWVVSVEIGRV
jgi:hypothetical protein